MDDIILQTQENPGGKLVEECLFKKGLRLEKGLGPVDSSDIKQSGLNKVLLLNSSLCKLHAVCVG